ncbi:MAG: hypothetical protein C0395_00835 [Gemmatimonas sp.]|nr:hypothetical protein [Gemmatimonas sp.]
MNIRCTGTRLPFVLAAAGLLLVAGLVIEMAFARPRLQEIQRLNDECASLQSRIQDQQRLESEGRRLAVHFDVAGLAELTARSQLDAVAYLGQALDRSGLRRLDMTTNGGEDFGRLRRSDFLIRASGNYAEIQTFVRDLESGRRLVSIDALAIKTMLESGDLEGRFNISIYDPTGVQ